MKQLPPSMVLGVIALCAFCAATSPALAEDAPPIPSSDPSWRLQSLVTVHRFLPSEPSADPDQPVFRYGMEGNRWKAMLGDGLVLAAFESDALKLGGAVAGFVELVNFAEGQPVPWQSYRANVGFELFAGSPRLARAVLPFGGSLHLGVGWFHESDHAADQAAYSLQYLRPVQVGDALVTQKFDNGNFSSYEYVKIRAIYRQPVLRDRLTIQSIVGARLFPPTIDSRSVRALRYAFLAEARLTARTSTGTNPFISGYFERVKNDFVARDRGFNFGLDHDPLRYMVVDLGIDLVSTNGAMVSPYLRCSKSHGRGIDFPRDYRGEFGFGLVILP